MKLTYEAIQKDPALVDKLVAAARRERAQAVYRLIIAPIIAFFRAPPRRRSRMIRRSAFG